MTENGGMGNREFPITHTPRSMLRYEADTPINRQPVVYLDGMTRVCPA
ncbi:MAG TPA: hypothetical protein VHL11_10635 [Phototrophicaceae bacterium]|nr:hypothetical protein [Phototrophicaceae bacterium]